jgi:transcriptional regulator with XRE-family HTH domain
LILISDTLSNELQRYAIGTRVKALRLKKKLALVRLASHTGLSPAMLSKIERGQMIPTLPTLLRIAMVFGVGLDHFFRANEEEPVVTVVRKSERLLLPSDPLESNPTYLFESLDYPAPNRRMEAFYAEFAVGAPASEPHRHGSAEFIYVLRGRLWVDLEGRESLLHAGDAMYFDASSAHSYRCDGKGTCAALVITA